MDTRTGNIVPGGFLDDIKKQAENGPDEAMKARLEEIVLMEISPTKEQLKNMQVAKYDPCPCGSGKKFKWCCWTGKTKEVK